MFGKKIKGAKENRTLKNQKNIPSWNKYEWSGYLTSEPLVFERILWIISSNQCFQKNWALILKWLKNQNTVVR